MKSPKIIDIVIVAVISVLITSFITYHVFNKKEENTYIKFQNRYSLDFDQTDYLMWIAQEKGGTAEDRANTMIVTLNRAVLFNKSIEKVVKFEMDKDMPPDYSFDYVTKKALDLVIHDKFDNTNGSLIYWR